jgi:tRNA-splicing ligase RtcB
MSAEIRKFLTDDIPLTAIALEKLERIARLKDVVAVAALPDIHAKPDNPFPTGTAILTKNTIYPTLIGQDIGCAMCLWHGSLKASQLDEAKIKKIFAFLQEAVTDNKPKRNYIGEDDLRSIIKDGATWALGQGFIAKEALDRIEHAGQFLGEDERQTAVASIPRDAYKGGLRKARSLGGGNHFLELQRVAQVLDARTAGILGLNEDDVLIWIHTGSSSLGKRLENYYTQRWNTADTRRNFRQRWRRLNYHFELTRPQRWAARCRLVNGAAMDEGLEADSPEGKRYMMAHRAAMNYALVNRIFLAKMMQQAVGEQFKGVSFQLLIDVAHESIQRESLKDGDFWVHRNGASRALPPGAWQDPWQRGLGQLLPLPGSLGTSSYIGMAQAGVEKSFWAVNHGAGRILEKPQAREGVSLEELERFKGQLGSKIFYAGKGDDLAEQVPGAFKNVSAVVRALEAHQLAALIVRTEPIASLKS